VQRVLEDSAVCVKSEHDWWFRERLSFISTTNKQRIPVNNMQGDCCQDAKQVGNNSLERKKRKLEELEAQLDGEIKKLKTWQSQLQHLPETVDVTATCMDTEESSLRVDSPHSLTTLAVSPLSDTNDSNTSQSDSNTESPMDSSEEESDSDEETEREEEEHSGDKNNDQQKLKEKVVVMDSLGFDNINNNIMDTVIQDAAEQYRLRARLLYLSRTKLLSSPRSHTRSSQLFYRMTNIHIERLLSAPQNPPPLIRLL